MFMVLNRRSRFCSGFTLLEMMITVAVSTILFGSVMVLIVDSQRGYNQMFMRNNSDVLTSGYIARRTFDSIVRKADADSYTIDENGYWLEVHYYSSDAVAVPDKYAKFYESDGDLNVEFGSLDPQITTDVQTVCENVTECTFKSSGNSAQMFLTIDDGEQSVTVVSSAIMHN